MILTQHVVSFAESRKYKHEFHNLHKLIIINFVYYFSQICQENYLICVQTANSNPLSFREIGKRVGVEHPQEVKHHLTQLAKKISS